MCILLQFPTHNCLCIASVRKIHFRYTTNTMQIHYKFITNKLQIHYIIALLIVWNRNCVRFAGGKATNVGKSPIVPQVRRWHQKHQQNQQESIWLKQRCICSYFTMYIIVVIELMGNKVLVWKRPSHTDSHSPPEKIIACTD